MVYSYGQWDYNTMGYGLITLWAMGLQHYGLMDYNTMHMVYITLWVMDL